MATYTQCVGYIHNIIWAFGQFSVEFSVHMNYFKMIFFSLFSSVVFIGPISLYTNFCCPFYIVANRKYAFEQRRKKNHENPKKEQSDPMKGEKKKRFRFCLGN